MGGSGGVIASPGAAFSVIPDLLGWGTFSSLMCFDQTKFTYTFGVLDIKSVCELGLVWSYTFGGPDFDLGVGFEAWVSGV